MPDRAGMFLRQIPAYEGFNSDQIPGGMIAVGIDLYITTDQLLWLFGLELFCSPYHSVNIPCGKKLE